MDKVGRTEPWCLCDVSLSCPQIHPWAINLTLWLKTTHLCWCMCVCQVWLLIPQQMLVISLVAFDHLEVFWRAWGRYLKHFAIICFVRVCVCMSCMCVWGMCTHLGFMTMHLHVAPEWDSITLCWALWRHGFALILGLGWLLENDLLSTFPIHKELRLRCLCRHGRLSVEHWAF